MFVWRTVHGRPTVQSDKGWADNKSTRKSVSARNIGRGEHLLRSWCEDQTDIAGEAERTVRCAHADTVGVFF